MTPLLLALLLSLQDKTPDSRVERLRSDRIEERAEAAAELRKRGKEALPALRAAAASPDADLARAAGELIAVIEKELAEEAARGTFAGLEKLCREAKTLEIRVSEKSVLRIGNDELVTTKTGHLRFKDGRRARMDLKRASPTLPDQGMEWTVVVDGNRVRRTTPNRGAEELVAAEGHLRDFLDNLLRVGLGGSFQRWDHAMISTPPKAVGILEADGFRPGPEPRSLTFRIGDPARPVQPAQILLKHLPDGRGVEALTVTARNEEVSADAVLDVRFEAFVVGGEISDDVFALPPPGK